VTNKIKNAILFFLKIFLPKIYQTRGTAAPIMVKTFLMQKILGINRQAYWPMHFSSVVSGVKNIKIGIGTAPGLSPGCYIQGGGAIYIGDYTIIAPNVGIISANHDIHDLTMHHRGVIRIGDYCWLGMNAVVLPNVTLGDFTVVGAGAVVTKSFPDGYCVLAGNPAKIIKKLEPSKCIRRKNEYEYYGYIQSRRFDSFRKKYLKI
jgi:acetyltransferase-like isoleucine patch superfamily enzyme